MLVCERKWVDVMFFHPDLPSETVRVIPDEIYLQKLAEGIETVLQFREETLSFLKGYGAWSIEPDQEDAV